MAKRNLVFANDYFYHVFNRSVGREDIFSSRVNLRKIFEIINFYRYAQKMKLSRFKSLKPEFQQQYIVTLQNQKPLVEIFTFTFMPNHYHLLLKQISDYGITRFISNIQNSLAKYLNLKNDRYGTLFQRPFKARLINTDEEFLHVSRYIHLNAVTDYIIEPEELIDYPYSSFPYYAKDIEDENSFVNTKFILDMFKSRQDYVRFVLDQAAYQRELGKIKDLILE